MDPLTTIIMLATAGTCIGALVNYFRHVRRHDRTVHVKIGDVEVSIRGPISNQQARELVTAIGHSLPLEH